MPPHLCRQTYAWLRVSVSSTTARNASLTSAIGRGIRNSRARESYTNERDPPARPLRSSRPRSSANDSYDSNSSTQQSIFDENSKAGRFRGLPRRYQDRLIRPSEVETETGTQGNISSPSSIFRRIGANNRYQDDLPAHRNLDRSRSWMTKKRKKKFTTQRYEDSVPERVKEFVQVPAKIPYTTPASEFIYGTSAVEAAIRCGRRQLYKLYIYQAVEEKLSSTKIAIRKLALSRGLVVKMAFGQWDRLLDKTCAGRPHNGCVLEASPLPRLPVTSLEPFEAPMIDHFKVSLGSQSREDAAVNGTDNCIPLVHHLHQSRSEPRYPVILLLDGIVDSGNLGAITRSAYYLGVDAVVFAGRNSAPLSPVTIKASAGAAENMILLETTNEGEFIRRSRDNGWRFYAAEAPSTSDAAMGTDATGTKGAKYIRDTADGNDGGHRVCKNVLLEAPTVLMLGSEATGLTTQIKSQADALVSIPGSRIRPDEGLVSDPARVDSLNVSVAAALLIQMFTHAPLTFTGVFPAACGNKKRKEQDNYGSDNVASPSAFNFN
ncbi:hypothetical protein Egran_04489 [Elaphomyces granulatus]|uniref:rRNA methyltransferase 1, mitochondrial n=1 Tax=Elaphomyces granulatus TaxID=519963 RepID=A0A232LV86_9EURO|nr:hypothetical protein Egran_04489 [Elaphomyces granulatus]